MKTKTQNKRIIFESILEGTIHFLMGFGLLNLSTFLLEGKDIFTLIWDIVKQELPNHIGTTYYLLILVLPIFIMGLIFTWISFIIQNYNIKRGLSI